MSDAKLARRIQASAWRSTGAMPEDTVRNWHDEDMRKLGKGRRSADHAPVIEDAGSFLTRPASLAFIFLIAFAVILTCLMWKEGRFDRMLAEMTPKVTRPSGGWIESAKALGTGNSSKTAQSAPGPAFENELEKAEQRQREAMAQPPAEPESTSEGE
jgi:hypothetical protein